MQNKPPQVKSQTATTTMVVRLRKTKDFFAWKNLKVSLGLNVRLSLLIPYFVIAILFIVLPTILLLTNAFQSNDYANKSEIAGDPYLWRVMGKSVYLGLAAAIISLIIIFPLTYVVARSKSKMFKVVALTLLMSPLFVFTISKVFALKGILIAIFDGNINNEGIMIFGMVYLYSPFMIIPIYSVLSTMPKSLIEASTDLGYSRVKTIFKVIVPYAMKGIFAGIALVFMMSATNLVISNNLLVGGHSAPKMIANVVNDYAEKLNLNEVSKIRGSLVALITIGVMIVVYGAIVFIPALIRKARGGVNV